MRYRSLVLFGAVAAVIAVASVPMAGQAPRAAAKAAASANAWAPQRTAWGDPDLQGTWRELMRVPLERPAGTKEFLTDAQLAAKLKEAEDLYARMAKGDTELNAERGLPLRNGVWYVTGEKPRVSRRTSQIVDPPDGRLPPWTPQQIKRWEMREAAKKGRGHGDSWEDRSLVERCIGVGPLEDAALNYYGLSRPPRETVRVDADEFDRSDASKELITFGDVPPGSVGYRILQAPGYVVVYTEGNNQGQYRIISLDGRPAPGPKIKQWTGVSRGRWEGNTLVVETTNVNDQQDGGRFIPSQTTAHYPGSGETLRVTEKFTRTGADTIERTYTVNDPQTYTHPYTKVGEWTRDDKFGMAPGVCHENNDGLVGVFSAGRADEGWSLRYTEAEQRNRQRRIEEMKAEWAARK